MDDKESCMGVCLGGFSPNNISGLRRPKNITFAIKMASSTKMMCTLKLLQSFSILAKMAKKRQKMSIFFSTSYPGNQK